MGLDEGYKRIALDALKGKWKIAVLAGFLAGILGGIEELETGIRWNISLPETRISLSWTGEKFLWMRGNSPANVELFTSGHIVLVVIAIIIFVVYWILGGAFTVGYARFNLNLIDGQDCAVNDLFSYLKFWGNAFAARFWANMYVILWSLLLIIPGIMAAYSYAMTEYILAENPMLSAGEAIRKSKEMMRGHRGSLFYMDISFIGWGILSILTLGIGSLWVTPYKKAARAAFYRDISKEFYV